MSDMPWWQWALLNPGWFLGGAMYLSHRLRKRDFARANTEED